MQASDLLQKTNVYNSTYYDVDFDPVKFWDAN